MSEETSAATPKPLVYDVGMNRGLNLAYYLEKGYRVVGIEANPQLAREVSEHFSEAVNAGDLVVLNVGVGQKERTLPFYVNHTRDVLSSFVEPERPGHDEWETIEVEMTRLSSIIAQHGPPAFVKIDVEHTDHLVLRELMDAAVRPPSISVEAHRVEVICMLVAMGYPRFHLVNGRMIGRSVRHQNIRRLDGTTAKFKFEEHAAGPFGNDLPGPWLTGEGALFQWLGRQSLLGSGWYDVHAASIEMTR